MGKVIYIRHSDDENHDCSKRQDCQLNEGGKKLAMKIGKKLIEKHGFPNVIYCSPFRRTLQTMENMLKKFDKSSIQIYKEPQLARYFSEREKQRPDVDPKTLKSNIDIHETYDDFKLRIETFSKEVEKLTQSNKVVWCITHTTVYKRLSKQYDIKIPKMIPFMHYFIIDGMRESSSRTVMRNSTWCERCREYH